MDHREKSTMRAVVWAGKPYHVTVQDWPRPTIQHPEDAIIRITTAGLCGSDLHTYHGLIGGDDIPWTLGHEAVGIVDEIGVATETFKVGDRVLIPGLPDDGHYETESTVLPGLSGYGFGKTFGNLGGAQAEYLRVPFADNSLVKIPGNGIKDMDYLLLADILPTAWTALDFSGFQAGDSVAVFGAGPVGLLCAHLALVRGASKVYSIDYVKERLDKAGSIGSIPIDFTDPRRGPASKQILELEPDGIMRSCDCCGYECVNPNLQLQSNYIIQEATKITSTGGGLGIIGAYVTLPPSAGAPNAEKVTGDIVMPLGAMFSKQLRFRCGSVEPYSLIPLIMNLLETGRINPRFIYTNEVGLEEAPIAYRRFSEKKEIKVAFRFPWDWEHRSHNVSNDTQSMVSNGNTNGNANGDWHNPVSSHLKIQPKGMPEKPQQFRKRNGKWAYVNSTNTY